MNFAWCEGAAERKHLPSNIMKTIGNIISKFVRPGLLVALGLLLSTAASQAAKMEIWVLTARNQWAQVIPGVGTAGRVVWSPAHYAYITDRVSRGESVYVTYLPTYLGEYGINRGYKTTCGTVGRGASALPLNDWYWTVPTNPACDNLRAWIQSNREYKEVRIPLGTRP